MNLLEALTLCRDTGARVRPVGTDMIFQVSRLRGKAGVNLGGVTYWTFAELLGEWEIVPESVEQRKECAP